MRRHTGGVDVRSSSCGAGSASAGGSATASGGATCADSATGISKHDVAAETDNVEVAAAVDDYREYVVQQVDDTVTKTKVFTDAVRAGDLAAAASGVRPVRVPVGRRIEPIAGLIDDIDGALDSPGRRLRQGVDDPAFTGWHRLEYLLFDQQSTDGGAAVRRPARRRPRQAEDRLATLELPPGSLPVGAAGLIEEVSEGKITGEEDRYSHTDLWDFAANVEGSEALVTFLTPAIATPTPTCSATSGPASPTSTRTSRSTKTATAGTSVVRHAHRRRPEDDAGHARANSPRTSPRSRASSTSSSSCGNLAIIGSTRAGGGSSRPRPAAVRSPPSRPRCSSVAATIAAAARPARRRRSAGSRSTVHTRPG